MKHLRAMVALIEDAGIATSGQSLFLLTIPAEVQNGVMLRGPLTGDKNDEYQPGFFRSEFMVVVRHQDVLAAETMCNDISALLNFYRRQLDEIFVTRVYPQTKPIPYPRSGAGTIEWGIAFDIAWGETV